MPDRTSVLFVCTGNVCRAAAAELLLRGRLRAVGAEHAVEVSSAGVRALVGSPVEARTAAALAERGVDSRGHSARLLQPALVDAADLVITMTREQRTEVARAVPRAVRRTFTLLELATLLRDAEPDPGWPTPAPGEHAARWRALPALAAARRALRVDTLARIDVPDPWGRPDRVHRQVVDVIDRALDVVTGATGLTGSRAPAGPSGARPSPPRLPPRHRPARPRR